MVPGPDPFPPLAIEIQLAVVDAVQVQPATVLTCTSNEPPLASTDPDEGLSAYVQAAADCVRPTVLSLTTSVVARGVAAPFAATVYESDASPDPEFPPETDTQP